MKKLRDNGFTIIELLIATVVFSVVLLIVTTAVVQFSRIYYKGIIQSRTQERARVMVEDVAQSLQFGKPPVGGNGTSFYCVGNRTYTFRENVQLSSTQRVLVARNDGACAAFTGMNPASGTVLPSDTTELAAEGMQLLAFDIVPQGTGGLYRIHVRLAYGGDDVMNNPNTANATCKAVNLGGQFCAVSDLTTYVTTRVK